MVAISVPVALPEAGLSFKSSTTNALRASHQARELVDISSSANHTQKAVVGSAPNNVPEGPDKTIERRDGLCIRINAGADPP